MTRVYVVALLLALTGCSGDLAKDKFYQRGTVVEVGTCRTDTAFPVCAVKLQLDSGVVVFSDYGGLAMVGMIGYRECWAEEDGWHCFNTARTNLRNIYKKGGARY